MVAGEGALAKPGAAAPLSIGMNEVNQQLPVAPPTVLRSGPAVLQILPRLDQGGIERGTADLARYLVERGWRALVASGGGSGEAELGACGARCFRLPVHTRNPLTIRANVRRLQRLIRDHDVRLVHARARAPAWSAYYAARRCTVPFVTTVHGIYGASRGVLKRHYNAIMARGDRVIAVSEYVAEHVREHYGVPEERLRMIRRGIDIDQFDPEAVGRQRVEALAERWGVRPGAKVVLAPVRVVRRGSQRVLLQAIAKLPRRDSACVIIESSKQAERELEAQIGALQLGNVARVVGACDDVPAALMLADVVVLASSVALEPLARLAVAAQAMGKPVIASHVGGLGETLMLAATGWLVEPEDPDALADALDLALAMPEEARASGGAGPALRYPQLLSRADERGHHAGLSRAARGPRGGCRGNPLIAVSARHRPSLDSVCAAPHFSANHRSATQAATEPP
jgi:glycosyltransferase involved in cell wall biosynthesis